MTQGDIHYSEQSVQNKVEKIKNSEDISEHNKQILLDLTDYMYGQDLSHTRVVRYLYSWTVMIEHIDWDLDEVEKKELIDLVKKINQNKIKDKELSEHTLREYKKAIRKLYTDYLSSKDPEFDGEGLCDFFTLTIDTKKVDPDNDVIDVNPSYDTPDEDSFEFLPMDAVNEEGKGIEYWNERDAEDCTRIRFNEGDTVYAKITPCTENGKIGFIEELDGEIAFGSTEFLVFSPTEKMDPKYVFYLTNLPPFRQVTISLMEGSTGRQRVPMDLFKKNLKIPVPPLDEQREIAERLSVVDEKIRQEEEYREKLEELKKGLMQDLLTGKIRVKTTNGGEN